MNYTIDGGNLPVATLNLRSGEQVFTQSGGMSWMTSAFEMSSNMEGGLFKGLGRMIAGESLFMTTYTARADGSISFASQFPGDILAFTLNPGQSLICQKQSFLVAERSVQLEIAFQKKLGAGFFGGEGFVMQKVTGPGTVFLEIDGSSHIRDLAPGEIIKVDTGNIAMYEPTVDMSVEMVKGVKNMFFGGEGLFLTTLKGPGKVWLQSMPFSNLANRIIAMVPKSN